MELRTSGGGSGTALRTRAAPSPSGLPRARARASGTLGKTAVSQSAVGVANCNSPSSRSPPCDELVNQHKSGGSNGLNLTHSPHSHAILASGGGSRGIINRDARGVEPHGCGSSSATFSVALGITHTHAHVPWCRRAKSRFARRTNCEMTAASWAHTTLLQWRKVSNSCFQHGPESGTRPSRVCQKHE